MKINPVGDQVLVKVDVEEQKSPGGLFLAPSAEPEAKNTGVVTAVGEHEVIKVKVGDHVGFEKGMGRRYQFPVTKESKTGTKWTEYEEYILIPYYDVLCVIDD